MVAHRRAHSRRLCALLGVARGREVDALDGNPRRLGDGGQRRDLPAPGAGFHNVGETDLHDRSPG